MKALVSLSPFALVLLCLLVGACEPREESVPREPDGVLARDSASPNARLEMVEELRQDLSAQRHPADGGGRAWIEPDPESPASVTAGSPGRWSILYEAGPLGVAEGGMVFLQVSPFWGWSTPQTVDERAPGYTTVTTDAPGVELQPATLGQQLLGIQVNGRALRSGERIRIVYGAGALGAMSDRYAERDSRFWISVDGDGDGTRKTLAESPTVDVDPGPPGRLILTLPSSARPGETVRLTAAVLDAAGNAGCRVAGDVVLQGIPPGLEVPPVIPLAPEDEGRKSVEVSVAGEGIYRLRAEGPAELSAESNPMVVGEDGMRILWADLQIHTNFSDGTGLPEDVLRYARDVAALDVAAITDHDHWGMLFLDQHPALWDQIREQSARFHRPGSFVTFLGYEWTSWIHGHRHVLYLGDEGEVLSSIDPRYDEPEELWDALRGKSALTIAHHSAGEPIATNWSIRPDATFEPVTEIVSVHGSSEAADSPALVPGAIPGNFVRDAVDRGYRLGFIGSGDGHDGHPGLAHLASPSGGVAAIVSEKLTREAVFRALRERRAYATNGPRILLRVSLAGHRMGSVLQAPGTAEELRLLVVSPAGIDRVEVIRSGKVVERVAGERRREIQLQGEIQDLRPGEYLYVRVVQDDGGMAWSSPFFVD
jgi:hypothetical protein